MLKFSYIKQTEREPSSWKFSNSLHSDNVYLNMMRGKIDAFISANHLPDDPRSNWDFLKFKTSFNCCSNGSGQNSVIPVVCNVPEQKLYFTAG